MKKSKNETKRKSLVVGTSRSLHIFDDPSWLRSNSELLQIQSFLERKRLIELGLRFEQELMQIIPEKNWLRSFDPPPHFFRIVDGDYNPISVSGTLSCGGRFNVGGAQVLAEFPRLQQAAGLYVSTTAELAQAEYDAPSIPSRNARRYRIKYIKKSLHVYDISHVLKSLTHRITFFPKPLSEVIEEPMSGFWKFIKYPKPSQVLGHWLRHAKNADGIVWKSLHHSDGENVFLFLKDEDEARGCLSAEVHD